MAERALGSFERWLLAAFGLGFWPFGPGTIASLATAAAIVAAARSSLVALGVAAALLTYGVATTLLLAGRATRPDGRGDPGWVVSDEVAGQALASAAALGFQSPWAPAVAFALFRAFDIVKPWPVGRLERVPGAWGVLLDDLAAGLLAAAGVWILGRIGLYA